MLNSEQLFKVYRSFDELVKAEETFKGKPILYKHEWVNPDNIPKVRGTITGEVTHKEPYLIADLTILDQQLIDEIVSGKTVELSPGYQATYVKQGGEYDGEQYDYIQKDLFCNHLAVVEEGRSGKDLRVMDHKGDVSMSIKTNDEAVSKEDLIKELIQKGAITEEQGNMLGGSNQDTVNDDGEGQNVAPSDVSKSLDANTAKDLMQKIHEALPVLEKYMEQEGQESQHQSEDDDSDIDEDKKTQAMDSKIMKSKTIDKALIKKEVMDEITKHTQAYDAVKQVAGIFNHNDKNVDEIYTYGYETISGKTLDHGKDPKTAFEAYIDGQRAARPVQKTFDSAMSGNLLKRQKQLMPANVR